MSRPLSNREKAFIQAYLRTWNATAAAREVGYSDPDQAGWQLLQRPKVKAAIALAMKHSGMDKEEVLSRLAQQARLNPAEFFLFEDEITLDANGQKTTRKIMAGINWGMVEKFGYLIKKVGYSRQNKPVLEFHDSQRALELIGKAHGLFVDRSENLNVDLSTLTDQQLERLANGESIANVLKH